MAKRHAFLVDADLCIGCTTCGMACKNLYHQEAGIVWRQVYPLAESIYPHRERAFYSLACNHCENPACLQGCPTGAYSQRADGIVVHNQDLCSGCRNCLRTCPFQAPRYNQTAGRVEKCSLCHDRIDAGQQPMCVQGCPSGALQLIDLNTFDDPSAVRFPAGFPARPEVNPSTRFKTASQPKRIVRRSV